MLINRTTENKKAIRAVPFAGLAVWLLCFCSACNIESPAGVDQTLIEDPIQGEEIAVLTDAPDVPPPITRKHRTKVIVNLEMIEVVKQLAGGVAYEFWTFGGNVPGKFIRIREGDLVEFHLANHPGNKMPHNIDLHAVTGSGGGAAASATVPGHESVFSFTALKPGLFVYHCASDPVGTHIANGMYGLILVEPKEGLPKVDREFYVMQSEFYTEGSHGEGGLQPFSLEKAIREEPDYVVFNGAVGALLGDHALSAEVGETIRLFVGNGGPSLISSFHVIGEIFDTVYREGSMSNPAADVQTTLIPVGGSAICEIELDTSGTFLLVDHSIFRAFNKGAIGMLRAYGGDEEENKAIYSGKIKDRIYEPKERVVFKAPAKEKKLPPAKNKAERIDRGKVIFNRICIACHQPNGVGIPGAFPPLAGSDFLNADKERAISIVANGLAGEIVVNGVAFNSMMPKPGLDDEGVASVLTYVYSQWGNSGKDVTLEEVKAVRKAKKKHN